MSHNFDNLSSYLEHNYKVSNLKVSDSEPFTCKCEIYKSTMHVATLYYNNVSADVKIDDLKYKEISYKDLHDDGFFHQVNYKVINLTLAKRILFSSLIFLIDALILVLFRLTNFNEFMLNSGPRFMAIPFAFITYLPLFLIILLWSRDVRMYSKSKTVFYNFMLLTFGLLLLIAFTAMCVGILFVGK